ncbi:hypothetical protein HYX16_01825 [Candidatus Woesearchaeota archaeon]|nr:hypothetical protein [Candidatus Woesearchaeota archaeon]
MTSIFLKMEGNTVRNRIWNFLIVHSEFDYSMKDISKFSEVSYTALKEMWKEFIKRDIVIHTRNVGKARMYKLNRENPQVEKFINYYWSIIDSETKKLVEKEKVLVTA